MPRVQFAGTRPASSLRVVIPRRTFGGPRELRAPELDVCPSTINCGIRAGARITLEQTVPSSKGRP